MATEKDRNNRGIQATTVAHGDHKHAEGAIPYDTLAAPGGLLGQPTMGKSRDQPPVGNLNGDFGSHGQAPNQFHSGGEKELLGQGAQGSDEGMTDDERPNISAPNLPGEAGTTNMGPQGDPVDWNSVGEYRYNEFPSDTLPQKIADGIQNVLPLT